MNVMEDVYGLIGLLTVLIALAVIFKDTPEEEEGIL